MFFKGSRYEKVDTTALTDELGREHRYKKVRFIPETTPRYGYAVAAEDRLDNIAFEVFHDPQRFWRICASASTRSSFSPSAFATVRLICATSSVCVSRSLKWSE